MGKGEAVDPRSTAGFQRDEYLINGVRTVVYSAGNGPPLVYWHGAGTFHGIHFARDWIDRFRVIMPYHPGFGESGEAPQLAGMPDYLLHYLDLFERLGLERFHLVGISLGGWMAAEFAAAHRHLLDKLVLPAPAGLNVPEHPLPDLSKVQPADLYGYLVADLKVLEPFLPRTPDENVTFATRMARESGTTRKIAPRGPVNPGLENWLHRITMPTLLMWGKRDRLLPVEHAERWMKGLPNARLELLDGIGHLILDESVPARGTIARFLARG